MTTVMVIRRFGQRALDAPSGVKALAYLQSCASFPVLQRKSLAVKRDLAVVAFVARLLGECRPSAILGRVRAVVVDALKAVHGAFRHYAGWFWSHVCVEVLKRVHPAIADADTSRAVVLVRGILWIRAALFDAQPDAVLRRAMCATGTHSVRSHLRSSHLAAKATATARLSSAQHDRWDGFISAAFAGAFPSHWKRGAYAMFHREAAESLAG